jgi:hypothetical protein
MRWRGPRNQRANSGARRSAPISTALFGLALSGAIAAYLAVKTTEEAMLGVALTLLGALGALLYELIRRFEDRVDGEDHRSALLAALDEAPWLLKDLREIAAIAKSALEDDQNSELFEDLIKVKINETQLFMQDLKRGRVRVSVGDVTPMSNQIDRVQERVRATTIPKIDNEWWLSPAGRDYLERNKRAIERGGVSIERIVLWEEQDDTDTLRKVIEEQRAAKVTILFAKRKEIANKKLKTNMAIYDDLTYNDVVFNSDGDDIYVEYYLEPSDAKQAIARFEQLRGLATRDVPSELTKVADPPPPSTGP